MPRRYLYIVRCADGALYTDLADDVAAAVSACNGQNPPPYVRPRAPVFLVHQEEYMNERDAEARLAHVREMDRRGKERLVATSAAIALTE